MTTAFSNHIIRSSVNKNKFSFMKFQIPRICHYHASTRSPMSVEPKSSFDHQIENPDCVQYNFTLLSVLLFNFNCCDTSCKCSELSFQNSHFIVWITFTHVWGIIWLVSFNWWTFLHITEERLTLIKLFITIIEFTYFWPESSPSNIDKATFLLWDLLLWFASSTEGNVCSSSVMVCGGVDNWINDSLSPSIEFSSCTSGKGPRAATWLSLPERD